MAEQERMCWDESARKAMAQALEGANWDNAAGEVTVDTGNIDARGKDTEKIVAKTREELENVIYEVGSNAWSGEVPFDGGYPVFEFDDSLPGEMLDAPEYRERMRLLGWE